MENRICCGKARFTVIAPELIRMEYINEGSFLDAPTLFAENRGHIGGEFDVMQEGKTTVLTTPAVTLTYTDDGMPFHAGNLTARIHTSGMEVDWHAGMESAGNLKGAMATLDGVEKAVDLPDGILSRDGWYVLDDSGQPFLKDGWIEVRPEGHAVDWYLFAYGHDYKLALRLLAAVSGKMELPRRYVFGSWYSRWWPYTDDEFMDIVDEYDENDFPLDILVMDMDWHYNDWTFSDEEKDSPHQAKSGFGWANGNMGWTGYSWNKKLIKDPPSLLKELHQKGISVTLNDHPHDGLRSHEDTYTDFMRELGYDPAKGQNLPFDAGNRDYMRAFFRHAHGPLERDGVDFWWLDWQQDSIIPYVKGKGHLRHLPWLNYLYYQHSRSGGKRGISFSRWGGFGDQKHPAYFSGDTKSTWETLAFEIDFTVRSGNSGCFFWGHDTGGFFGERDGEMYVRWVQFCMTSASLRLHSQRDEALDRRPWKWAQMECDAMRKFFHLRSQLMPYIYSTARQCREKCLPMLRPMYLEYPDCEAAYENPQQYFWGDALLAAPITSPGSGQYKIASQRVWVKEGTYYNFFTGGKLEGEVSRDISCGLFSFPLFAKAGVPIPMQPYNSRMTRENPRELIVRCFPGVNGQKENFTLYEDDGISQQYETGSFLETELTYERSGNAVAVTITPRGKGYPGMPQMRDYTIELPYVGRRAVVLQSSHPATTEYDEGEDLNIISMPGCRAFDEVKLVVKFES